MSFIELLRSVLLNIKSNKFRVFLTSLGIIIGSFTIIMVVGIGKGSEQAVAEQYKKLSVETIMMRKSREYKGAKELTLKDIPNLIELENVKDASISISASSGVSYGATTYTTMISGISESYQHLLNLEMETGEYITDADGTKRNKVVVLGSEIAQNLFGDDVTEAVGKSVTIKGRKYSVKGVYKQVGDSGTGGMGSTSTDDGAFMPYEVATKYIAGRNTSPNFSVQANDINSVAVATEELKQYIESITEDSEAYMIIDAGSRLISAQESAKTMSVLLVSVATIVLIVGGIGIMNVLFVSVKERTKEIGILKSIGASRKDILLEFLLESIFISVAGGVIGGALSIAVIPLLSYIDLAIIPSAEGIGLGLVFSIVTGTFFGYYPAVRASKLKPIDALNYE